MKSSTFYGFYKLYPIDHWIYKIMMLKNLLENYDNVKEILHENLLDIIDKDYLNMLKAEIHFTSFQIIEALFELVFALEKRKDKFLWYFLSFSDYRENFRRIRKIANGDICFLEEEVELPSKTKVQLIQYIFYFGTFFPILNSDMKNNINKIKKFLIEIAKIFTDRGEYNSYKHSLRFYQSPIDIEFGELLNSDIKKKILQFKADETLTFLNKNKQGNIDKRTKAFDIDKDINIVDLCHRLISNIINLRKRAFLTPKDKAKAWFFDKITLDSMLKSKHSFIEMSSTVLWKKQNPN